MTKFTKCEIKWGMNGLGNSKMVSIAISDPNLNKKLLF
jgi:hypothetical protein